MKGTKKSEEEERRLKGIRRQTYIEEKERAKETKHK
jgi:hypothetical protein